MAKMREILCNTRQVSICVLFRKALLKIDLFKFTNVMINEKIEHK